MMLIIIVWHFQRNVFEEYGSIMAHGYMAVDFFFILSGYLMYRSANKPDARNTIEYTLNKIRRFAPDYLIVILFLYLRHMVVPALLGHKSFDLTWALQAIPEALFLQNTGIWTSGVNYPMWYVSVLLFGGGIVYSFLRYNKRLTISIILPITILLGYTFLFSHSPKLRIDSFQTYGAFYMPMVRGISGIGLGVELAHVVRSCEDLISRIRIWVIDSLAIIGGGIFTLCIMEQEQYDRYLLIAIPLILLGCVNKRSLFNRMFKSTIWVKLGGITWQMYVYHGYILISAYLVFLNLLPFKLPAWACYLLYVLFCILLSALLKSITQKIPEIIRPAFIKNK